MKSQKYLLYILLLLKVLSATAQKKIFPNPLSERIANYTIDVSLNEVEKTLIGNEVIVWKNSSNIEINDLQFHLYLNAFKNAKSTFMKESEGGRLRSNKMDKAPKKNWGNTYITSFKTSRGENLYPKMKFIQPDDLNINDQTVMQVLLEKPIKPNESITLYINFKAKLPKIFARTGFVDNYYLIAQWFPKIGVFENGRWNCHQFHANTEFYADFGNYDIKIKVPESFKVGATGVLISEKKIGTSKKEYHFYAEDVHDFAWTASPDFIIHEKQWNHIKLKVFIQPEHASMANRYFESVEKSLAYFSKNLGYYPYPVLTMVDPPIKGSGSGGMEYPTFITCGSYWGVGKWAKLQEIVTVHEFGHQYFQGMLASNEFEESWLDEGFNQYYEGRIMDEAYGKGSQFNFLGFQIGDVASSRQSYVSMKNPSISEVNRPAWKYPKGAYSIMTYTKTATWMRTLDNLIGRDVMDEVMKTYFSRWKFKHPSAKDFIAIVNEIVPKRLGKKFGNNMNWYFEQVLYKAPVCDYAVTSISTTTKNHRIESIIKMERKGEMQLPTELLVTFEDNSSEMINWDGNSKFKHMKFKKKVKSVWIDPKNKNLMDLNIINNSKSIELEKGVFVKYSIKALFWIQLLLQSIIG